MFGYDSPEKKIELVTFRLRARLRSRAAISRAAPAAARKGSAQARRARARFISTTRPVSSPARFTIAALSCRATRSDGPAIVEQMDCTTVVPPDFGVRVDDAGNLFSSLMLSRR